MAEGYVNMENPESDKTTKVKDVSTESPNNPMKTEGQIEPKENDKELHELLDSECSLRLDTQFQVVQCQRNSK